ncbi:nickel pincer cofactor biosynthesis protein LarB [Silvibacterium dinghuense]|uniref:Nickel pincer cofactor biosynthesis protein LarB n=1 Tax=Silvibacterium dinghuense TaxID=1560006 RepID=A0A4Q1SH57_9BACT|nr:nickel pincer cofactor biosynthesis protein LarB [Silvibacterium dinghuense]RXS96663.1 nickel pincer cofactor biosynthesis protein LarB [Silvibacterium dinghuense]GGG92635.1 1-(5-phosphoribosyl)-5-amino-4-imidazole-carboxylate carboxylase [Silvibacterium dinghuense]
MKREVLAELLEAVKSGGVSTSDALEQLARLPYEDAGMAKIDHHRTLRLGLPEVIYAEGKTPEQVAEIFRRMADRGGAVLATRAGAEAWNAVKAQVQDAEYHALARVIGLRERHAATLHLGPIAVVCAGTSDLPVAEEAAVVAEYLGVKVSRIVDVGVAGLHRILSQREALAEARAVIVCAGMEGALPSVVGGLVAAPVIAVPTSVGYGAAFGGLAALLGMLNSCSPNVTVVNIDNGFGAAYVAAMMLRAGAKSA